MTSSSPTSPVSVEISERTRTRIMRQRRGRVVRGLGLFVSASILMMMMAMANRDAQARKGGDEQATRLASLLQQTYEHSGYPPQRFPDEAIKQNISVDQYYFNAMYPSQARSGGAVGVCYRDQDFMLGRDGYYVTLFSGGHFSWQWMDDDTFHRQAGQLGFRAP